MVRTYFSLAANLSADVQDVTVEVFYDGQRIGDFYHEGGVFETYSFEFLGTGETSELEFKITSVNSNSDNTIDASANTRNTFNAYKYTADRNQTECQTDAYSKHNAICEWDF